MRPIFICCAVLLLGGWSEVFATSEADLEGIWFGTLTVPDGTELRIVTEFFPGPDGQLQADLISLDQGGQALRANAFSLVDDDLHLEVSIAGIVFEGSIDQDGKTIAGEILQGGGSLPLTMTKVDEVPGFPRPQRPFPPFPYREEAVVYENASAGIRLAGTLTLPTEGGPFPAVLLITGSGAQDRDETVFYHRPFLVLADYLTRRGIAVLRADDRGFGESTGDFNVATSEHFVDDALAGFAYLKSHPEIDPDKIGLIGHSEGGLIAPIAAVRDPQIAFIVMLAGPGIQTLELLDLQRRAISRAEGASDEELEVAVNWFQQAHAIVLDEPDDGATWRQLRDLYNGLEEAEKGLLDWPPDVLELVISQLVTPWYRYFLAYDPAPVLEQVSCPVLALNGSKDVQVTPRENLAGIEAAFERGGNPDVTLVELPDLNHFFQTAETGAVSEYVEISETFAPVALEQIAGWIGERTGTRITAVAMELAATLPGQLALAPNFPNPFNSTTTIRYALPDRGEVDLAIFNAAGQRVATLIQGEQSAGFYTVYWNGRGDNGRELASGVYLYRLQARQQQAETRKLLLVR